MLALSLFAVAAVLTQESVVFIETDTATVLREVVLPMPAVALFAAPDGNVVLPLAAADETVIVAPTGPTRRWPGRVFPLFFDEVDRMHAVLPEMLLVLSYPERLPILRVPIPGFTAPWRAACSRNGLIVATCARPDERKLVVVVAEPGAIQREVALAGEPRSIAVAPDGAWVGVGLTGGVEIVVPAESRGRGRLELDGEVRCLAASADGRDLLAGTATGDKGALVTFRVALKAERGARKRDTVTLDGPVESLAVADKTVVAVAGGGVVVLGKEGRRIERECQVPGARQVVFLPQRPESTVPRWSEPVSP